MVLQEWGGFPWECLHRHLWFHFHNTSVFLSQGKFQLYGFLFKKMSEIISFGNLPHPYPKVSLFLLLVTWQRFDPTKGSPSRDPTEGVFSSRPSGHFPSNPRELTVHRSSGTLWIDVTVPYPRARGAQQGVPVPIPSAGGKSKGDSARGRSGARRFLRWRCLSPSPEVTISCQVPP